MLRDGVLQQPRVRASCRRSLAPSDGGVAEERAQARQRVEEPTRNAPVRWRREQFWRPGTMTGSAWRPRMRWRGGGARCPRRAKA
eukprot:364680-Chlamydomonas_euryale.AAC.3